MNTQKFYISINGKQLWDFIDGIDDYYALSEQEYDDILTDLESLEFKPKTLINFLKGQKRNLLQLSKQVADYVSPENKYCINTNISKTIIPLGYEAIITPLFEDMKYYLHGAHNILRQFVELKIYEMYYREYFLRTRYCPTHLPDLEMFRDYLNKHYDNILKKDTDLPCVDDKENVVFLENGDLKLHVWVQLYKGRRLGWWSSEWYTIKDGANKFNKAMEEATEIREKWEKEAPEQFLMETRGKLYTIRLDKANKIMNSLSLVNMILIPLFMLVKSHDNERNCQFFRQIPYKLYLTEFNLLFEKLVFINTYRFDSRLDLYTEYLFNRLRILLDGHRSNLNKEYQLLEKIRKQKAPKGQKELKEFILNEKQFKHVLKSHAEVA